MNYVTSAKIVRKKHILNDVIELILESESKIKYMPGSFVQLAIGEYNASEIWPDSRTFSIAGYHFKKIRFLIQKKGSFTSKIINETKIGDVLTIKYPFGNMFHLKNMEQKNVFIAGGLGITPFLSLTEFFVKNTANSKIELFYSARSSERLIYMDYFFQNIPRIQIFTTQKTSRYTNRRINKQDIKINNYSKDTHFYVCGSPNFIGTMQSFLKELDFANIHVDEWE